MQLIVFEHKFIFL